MRYTKEKPKKEGYYFLDEGGDERVVYLKATEFASDVFELTASTMGEDEPLMYEYSDEITDIKNVRWAGPIKKLGELT
jgi:hypothetical protein